jgi:hypothetical protein
VAICHLGHPTGPRPYKQIICNDEWVGTWHKSSAKRTAAHRLLQTALLGLLVGLLFTSGCASSATGESTSQVRTNWQNFRYSSLLISAPSPWHIYRNTDCVPNEHPGALVLGTQTGTSSCVDQVGPPGTVVKVSELSPGVLLTLPPPVSKAVLHVGGLTILSSAYSTGLTIWVVTSAGVEVTSTGPNARAVLATLRQA